MNGTLLSEGPVFRLYDDGVASIRRPRPELDSPVFTEALREVAAALPDLPGVARVTEVGRDEEGTFLGSASAKGVTFDDRIRKLAPLSPQVALGMLTAAADALAPLHAAGLVHGDLRPENILFHGEGVVLQLPGIYEAYATRKAVAEAWLPHIRPYAAPEILAEGFPDARSDVYALGVTLFQLLTGRLPVGGEAPDNVPAAVAELYRELTTANPTARPADASEVDRRVREVHDTVRFGRPSRTASSEPKEIAPMPKNGKDAPARDREAPAREADVPGCLRGVFALSALVCAIMVGTFLYFNSRRPALVTVPTLEGLNEEQASRVVGELKLRLAVASRRSNDKTPRGEILDTTPSPGSRLPVDGVVNVAVSDGPSEFEAPNVVGLPSDRAASLLSEVGLVPTLLPDPVPSALPLDRIARQAPPARTKVKRGDDVQLSRSGGVAVSDGPKFGASVTVTVSGVAEDVRVRVDVEDAAGVRVVHDELHKPQDRIPLAVQVQGSQATFRIYYDDRLVKTIEKSLAP